MSSRTIAVTGALLVALALPAGAAAAEMAPLAKSCYVTAGTAAKPQGEAVLLQATGFAPNSKVDLAIDGAPVAGATGLQTDATGAIGVTSPFAVPAPFVATGSRDFTITLTQQPDPANPAAPPNVATATAKATALGVSVKPRRAKPSSVIAFKGSGFTQDKPVYAHYVYKGKVRRTVRMKGSTGQCGAWRTRRPQIPVSDPGTGTWTVQFDQLKRYVNPAKVDDFSSVFVQLRIQVTRVFG